MGRYCLGLTAWGGCGQDANTVKAPSGPVARLQRLAECSGACYHQAIRDPRDLLRSAMGSAEVCADSCPAGDGIRPDRAGL